MTDLSPNPHSPADTWTFTFLSPPSFTFSILRPLHLHSSCLKCCSAFRAAGSWEKMLWQITSSTFNLPPVLLCIRLCRLRHHGWRHGESYLCNQHFTAPILYKSNPPPLNQPIPPTSLFPKQFGTYFEKQPDNIQSFSPSHPFTFNLLCVFSSNPTCTDLLSVSRSSQTQSTHSLRFWNSSTHLILPHTHHCSSPLMTWRCVGMRSTCLHLPYHSYALFTHWRRQNLMTRCSRNYPCHRG